MPLLTILTPTYNRAERLQDLYESLKRQMNKNFCWFVVDDGSTDGTEKLIKGFQREQLVDIRFIRKENGGKHTAINRAAPEIDSELTMIVDSDDLLLPDATQTIFNDWMEVCEVPNIGGICYLRGYSGFEEVGDKWPNDKIFGNTITTKYNKGIKGDKCEVLLTQILKSLPFPEYRRERFFSECYLWIEMAKTYDFYLRNKILYVTEYLDGGLTQSGRAMQVNNPRGAQRNAMEFMYKKFSFKLQCKNALLYTCYGRFIGQSFGKMQQNSPNKLLTWLMYLPSYVLYKKWLKYKK